MLPSFERAIFAFADTTVRQTPQGVSCSGDGTVAVARNSTTMALHLAEISQAVAQEAHAVLLMAQFGQARGA